jgi:hypothetical protein
MQCSYAGGIVLTLERLSGGILNGSNWLKIGPEGSLEWFHDEALSSKISSSFTTWILLIQCVNKHVTWGSKVTIVTSLWAGRWRKFVSILSRCKRFIYLFSEMSRLSLGNWFGMGWSVSLRIEQLAAEHSPLFTSGVKNDWRYTSIPTYASISCNWKSLSIAWKQRCNATDYTIFKIFHIFNIFLYF